MNDTTKNNRTKNQSKGLLGTSNYTPFVPSVPLLPLPREPQQPKYKYDSSNVKLYARIIVGALLFIEGFNISNTEYFNENPLFGVRFLAEVLISLTAGVFGFFVVPMLFLQVRAWLEQFIATVISEIVNNFWAQQTKKIHEAQKLKQEKKALAQEKKRLEEERKKNDQFVNGILIDTSVLIDGRILDIVKTGFFDKNLLIPQSVLDELHLISDNKEGMKRQRGRRGLDIIKSLKGIAKVYILNESPKNAPVDKDLIELAKKYKLKVLTLDFNLNKVASVSGIKVLNINDLVNAVKAVVLPGELIQVQIIQEGKEKDQGVGYLADGTMIVVEGAKTQVGNTLNTKVTRVIQGPAGKMIFCKIDQSNPTEQPAS